MSTIDEIVAQHITEGGEPDALVTALQEREDEIRENLTLIAANLGTYPEFVAEAFASVGLGTPPTPEVRAMLREQFSGRMAWLIAQQQEGGGA